MCLKFIAAPNFQLIDFPTHSSKVTDFSEVNNLISLPSGEEGCKSKFSGMFNNP